MRPIVLSVLLGLCIAGGTQAQGNYPVKPVKILVGFPPGVPGDVIPRVMAPRMSEGLGQQVLIENRPGAGSSIAAEAVARSPGDGYTLYVSSIANPINQLVYRLTFDLLGDLAPISLIADVPGLLVASAGGPATLQELVAAAKSKPGTFAYGSSGNGTATHLYGELLGLATGTRFTHVPYKGSSQTVTDLLAGRIQLMFTPGSTVMPHVKAGKLVALAAVGRTRVPALPDVPTFLEAGVAGYEAAFWFGLHAPAATPRAIVDRLNRETVRVLNLPEIRAQLTAQSIGPVSSTVEDFARFVREDMEKWARVVKAAGVKGE